MNGSIPNIGSFMGTLEHATLIILFCGALFSRRILFAAIAAMAMVLFSESMYWYKLGFQEIFIWDRVNIYLYPTFFCLWAVHAFRVRRIAPLFLCAAIYGLTVEGGLVWIIFESDTWRPMSISNTPLSWHAPFSVMFGLFYLRKSLLARSWIYLIVGCVVWGIFWGVWSTTQWLPETIEEYSQEEESRLIGQIPVLTFGMFTLMITAILGVAHWALGRGSSVNEPPHSSGESSADNQGFPVFTLLPKYWQGRGVWLSSFKPHGFEAALFILFIWIWHVTFCVPNALGNLEKSDTLAKLPIAVGVILLALWGNRK